MRSRTLKYALAGALLALGAPLGWLAIRVLGSSGARLDLASEIRGHLALYSYLLWATAAAFSAYGASIGVLADRLVVSNDRLKDLVSTDALTALKNSRYFRERIQTECARAARENRPLALILADLDHFKRINDLWGHALGDEALAHAARVIAGSTRNCDVTCRIGGEEFGVICPGAGLDEGFAIAERIRSALEAAPLIAPEIKVQLTGSLGVAGYRAGTGPETLFRSADQALYAAKRTGRNQVQQDLAIESFPVRVSTPAPAA